MRILLYVIMALTIILSFFVTYFQVKGKFYVKFLVKTLASLLFVLSGVLATSLTEQEPYHYGILAALILGFVGDIIICTDHFADKKFAEITGLIALAVFLFGHMVYACVFRLVVDKVNYFTLIPAVIMPIFMALLMRFKVITPKKEKIPILVYAFVIGLMVASALNYTVQGGKNSPVILTGALLFALSDCLLSVYYYGKKLKVIAFIYLPAYYAAQILFVLGIL